MADLILSNLPTKMTIKCSQGADLYLGFKFSNPAPPDGDGLGVDLTGSTIRAKVRKTYASVSATATFDVTIANQTTNKGEFAISLADTVTAAIPAGEKITDSASKYVWDLEWVDSVGFVRTVYRGPFLMEAEATK